MNTCDTYTVTFDWMLDLPLDIWETTIYSVLWGFTQDGETVFHGSRAYLARKAKCSTDKVDKCLRRLLDLGLIHKNEKFVNGIKFCEYWCETAGSRCERQVAVGGGMVAAGSDKGSRPERHNNKEYNADKSANKDKSASPAFDFKKAVMEMGVTQQHADDWMAVRKAKRMTNTKTAFERLQGQIEKACRQYDITPDACVAYAASKDWGGFDAGWEDVKNIKTSNSHGTSKEDRVRAAIDAEVAKFAKPLHFGVYPTDER